MDPPDCVVIPFPVQVDPLASAVADLIAEYGYYAVVSEVEMHLEVAVARGPKA